MPARFTRFSILLVVCAILAVPTASFGWKFASIADSRGDNNGVNTAELTSIVNRINQEHVDFVIFGGDAVTGSTSDATLSSQFDDWLGIMNTLNCPWYYTPGNHEIQTATAQNDILREKVSMPTNGPAGDEEMAYSFDYNNAHFVFLNSDHFGLQHQVQRSWLTTDLANRSQPHIFVMSHDPAYPTGPHIGSSLDTYPTERDDFWNVMTVAGVRMYLCGHEHLYQRSTHGGIYQILNGTCGAPISTGVANTTAEYQYVIVTVDGNNVSGECRNDTGVLLDSWSYTVSPPTVTTCSSARALTNGTRIALRDKVVTHMRGDAIYVEEDDRFAAFKAVGITGISAGDRVNITGILQTGASGEREIQGSAMRLSSGNALPPPIAMSQRDLLGAPDGYNPGADDAAGVNNTSMLLRICGKVTSIGAGADAGTFYMDDGSGIVDGTEWAGIPNAGVKVVWNGTVTRGETRVVTGICSLFKNGSKTCRLVYSTDKVTLANWEAYNDVVYSTNPAHGNPLLKPNVTTFNIGTGSPTPASGHLVDFATGIDTGVMATLTQNGGVVWQPDGSSPNYYGGADCASGTDAYSVFNPNTASLVGVVHYGTTGWYVEVTFTGLNPAKRYEFATSANRHKTDGTYNDRITKYYIYGANEFTNSSTPGVTIADAGASSTFCTGNNTANGYVARWTNINPGGDGTFKVRAGAGSSQYKAYAFSAFKLIQSP